MRRDTLKRIMRELITLLSHQRIVFIILPWLMVLLVAGTVSQRWIGLYQAQKLFFDSPFIWLWDIIPIPGTPSLLAVITLGLLLKFIFNSPWQWRRAGIHLTHLGVLLLLLGGLVTMFDAQEGSLTIPEGQQSNAVFDYYQRELVVLKNDALIGRINQYALVAGETIQLPDLPFQLVVQDLCRDCAIQPRGTRPAMVAPYRGMAAGAELVPQTSTKTEEEKIYGVTIGVRGAGADYDGTYVLFDLLPKPLTFVVGADRYTFVYAKEQRLLPFALELQTFTKTVHPGTDKPKEYESRVVVHDGAVRWPARIAMNEPLRYKGYTFFQSSFLETDNGQTTVLAVVRNRGWVMPYVGTFIMALGLLVHCGVVMGRTKTNRP